MENANDNQTPSNPNFFKRTGQKIANGVNSVKERTASAMMMGQEEIQAAMLKNIMPMVKRMIPGIEDKLKAYLGGFGETGDGIEKCVVLKRTVEGKLDILIFDASLIKITATQENGAKALLNKISLDEYVTGFMKGDFDHAANDI